LLAPFEATIPRGIALGKGEGLPVILRSGIIYNNYFSMPSEFESSQDRLRRRNMAESSEIGLESKETKEDKEAKKMAARERAEIVSREVKTTKQQIQNIVANMAAVVKAVAAIRAQLKMSDEDKDIPSVKQDAKILAALKKKLDGLYGEIKDLKAALLIEERRDVEAEHGDWSAEEIAREAERRAEEILIKLDIKDIGY